MSVFGHMVEALVAAKSHPTSTLPTRTEPLGVDQYPITVQTVYRPVGAPAAMLRALGERKQMTSGELAKVCGLEAKQIGSVLRPALRYGLVKFVVSGDKRHWEWTGP